jgi:hypothetical protein
MPNTLFENLLTVLTPTTLAALVVDVEEAQADWARFPAEAPDPSGQAALAPLPAELTRLGEERAAAEGLDFAALLEQARDARTGDEWLAERNRRTQQNWFSDYQ